MSRPYFAKKCVVANDDILICGGDTETTGLGGKLLMVQWGMMGKTYHATGDNMVAQFFDVLLSWPKPAVWYFHFGQYDWRYFLDYIREQKLITEICLRTETDIYEIRVKRNEKDKWSIMRDSGALWPESLKKLALAFCPEYPKLEVDIEHFDPDDEHYVEYAERDVRILITALPRLFDMMREHFGVYPSATTAGTAMRAWQNTLPDDVYYDASKWGPVEQFMREGYYGGIVFLTSNIVNKDCETYDINSSYPAVMEKFGVPKGNPIYTESYEEEYPGIYRVRVKTPDNLIVPILPARNMRGVMRWFRGEFETVVTTQELQFAAKHGYEILEVMEGYYFEGMEYPFNDLISKTKSIRKEFKGKANETLAKLIQNSLYGRFVARRMRTKILDSKLMKEEDFENSEPFDEFGIWYVTKFLDETINCIPQWGVFITANARLQLLRAVYAIGPENCLYADTDSITVRKGFGYLIDVGSEYGQFKLEKEWKVFRAIAPKVYSGILAKDFKDHKAGTFYGAAKGLPRKGVTEIQWRELLEDGATQAATSSLSSLKIAFKNGVTPARQLTRKSSELSNSQNFIACANGDVRVNFNREQQGHYVSDAKN